MPLKNKIIWSGGPIVKRSFLYVVICAEILAVIAFIAYQIVPVQIISIFGKENGLYNEFAEKCFRIFLLATILNGFQTVSGLFAQSIGKAVKAAIISLSRQIVFLLPAELILSHLFGIMGVLWAGPVADTLAFVLALVIIMPEWRKFSVKEPMHITTEKNRHMNPVS